MVLATNQSLICRRLFLVSLFAVHLLSQRALASQICPSLPGLESGESTGQSPDKPTVRIALRDWLSAEILSHVLRISLDIGGHRTELVDMSGRSSSKMWSCDLSHYECKEEEKKFMVDADPESWRKSDVQYQKSVREAQEVFDVGPTGYVGHSGLYFAPTKLRDEHPTLLMHFAGAHKELTQVSDLFPRLTLAANSTGASLGISLAEEYPSWLEHGTVDATGARWIPSYCQPEGMCSQIYHKKPSWDTGILESLVLTHGMPYEIHYLGDSFDANLRKHFSTSSASPLLHYWYTPDPLLAFMSSHRMIFPTFIPGCAGIAGAGHRECDFEASELTKFASARLRWQMPEAFASYVKFQISTADISAMMSKHLKGGGPISNAQEIACHFAETNLERIKSWSVTCEAGMYFDKDKLKCLRECTHGLEVSSDGLSCLPCAMGRYQPFQGAACTDCAPGSFSNVVGATKCYACLPGEAAGKGGGGNCTKCGFGHFSDTPGLSTCKSCAAGKYNSELGKSACSSCPIGKFAPVDGSAECKPCIGKGVRTAWVGALSEDDCVCPPSTHFVNTIPMGKMTKFENGTSVDFDAMGSACFPCEEEYMICQESFGRQTFLLKEGFMSSIDEPYQVYKCGYLDGCQGTRDPFDLDKSDVCTGYHMGPTCFRCKDGFAARADRCISCSADGDGAEPILGMDPWDAKFDSLFALVLLLLFCTKLFDASMKPPTAERLLTGLLVTFLQACAILSTFDIRWPPTVRQTVSFGKVLEFNVDMIGLRMDCFTGTEFRMRLFGRMLWPLFLQVGFAIVFVFWKLIGPRSKDDNQVKQDQCGCLKSVLKCLRKKFPDKIEKGLRKKIFNRFAWFWPITPDNMLNCMQQTHFSLFISVLAISLSMFNCMEHPNKRKTVERWPDVGCDSEEWWEALPIGLSSLLVYCVGFASWIIYLVKVAPLKAATDISFGRRYYFIWKRWHPGKWWFSLVELGFAVCLNMNTIFAKNGYHQVYLASTLFAVYMIIVIKLKPWKFIPNTIVDCCMKFALCLMCNYSTIFIHATEEELSVVEAQFTTVLVLLQGFPIVLAFFYLFFVLLHKNHANTVQEDHVQRILFAERFRGVMNLATHLSNAEFHRLITLDLVDNDRAQLLGAMDVLTSVVLKMQPGPKFQQRRIIPGHPYIVADNENIEQANDARGIEWSPAAKEKKLLQKIAEMLFTIAPPAHLQRNSKASKTSVMMTKAFKNLALPSVSSLASNSLHHSKIDFDKLFHILDVNGDHVISVDEFVNALRYLVTQQDEAFVQDLDVDGDGDIDDEDFSNIFKIIDLDGDGLATFNEFCAVLRAVEVIDSRSSPEKSGSSPEKSPLNGSPEKSGMDQDQVVSNTATAADESNTEEMSPTKQAPTVTGPAIPEDPSPLRLPSSRPVQTCPASEHGPQLHKERSLPMKGPGRKDETRASEDDQLDSDELYRYLRDRLSEDRQRGFASAVSMHPSNGYGSKYFQPCCTKIEAAPDTQFVNECDEESGTFISGAKSGTGVGLCHTKP